MQAITTHVVQGKTELPTLILLGQTLYIIPQSGLGPATDRETIVSESVVGSGTTNVGMPFEVDLTVRRPMSESRQQSSARYRTAASNQPMTDEPVLQP